MDHPDGWSSRAKGRATESACLPESTARIGSEARARLGSGELRIVPIWTTLDLPFTCAVEHSPVVVHVGGVNDSTD